MLLTDKTIYTTIDLWYPRYNDKYTATGERCFLPAVYKVKGGANIIVIKFSKAKHMAGLRFCMKRSDIMTYPIETNGTIDVYAVPESKWEEVENDSIWRTINELWPEATTEE